MDLADAVDQLLGRSLLQHNSGDTQVDGSYQFGPVLRTGEENDPSLPLRYLQVFQCRQAVEAWHPEVEKKHIRREVLKDAQYVKSAGYLADHFKIFFQPEQSAQAV